MISLNWLDWSIVGVYFAVMLWIGIKFADKAKGGIAAFFVSGRSLPWWLAGTSMVATTFSTDTPLLVTELTRTGGIAGNWAWWSMLLCGMLTVFFFARMWRRSAVVTDAEYYELRYSGKPAAFLRGFRSIYLGLIINCLIMGSVSLAMGKIGNTILGWEPWTIVVIAAAISIAYTVMSGLWGVVITDLPQFAIAIVGSVAVAYYAVTQPEVGGLTGLFEKIDPAKASVLPAVGEGWELILPFVVMIGVQWWASWYPGAEPGGGGYIVQRVFACKDEKQSFFATLWFNIAHYAVRPWPWILAALATMVLVDSSAITSTVDGKPFVDHGRAYPMLLQYLPNGLLGLMFCSFLAAYMSTIDTHVNWGTSYVVNDLYKRFMKRDGDDAHYVAVSRAAMIVLTAISCLVSFLLPSQTYAFNLLLTIGAGTGPVYLLRWYWWRVNAWSEITAMIGSMIVANVLVFGYPELPGHFALLINVGITSVAWILVTLVTPPTDAAVLERFYRKIRPAGPGWGPLSRRCSDVVPAESIPWNVFGWLMGVALVYSILLGMGFYFEGKVLPGVGCTALAVASVFMLRLTLRRTGWTSEPPSVS